MMDGRWEMMTASCPEANDDTVVKNHIYCEQRYLYT